MSLSISLSKSLSALDLPLEPAAGMECHGALIELDAKEYEKLWHSEGGLQLRPGYKEVPVLVYPYDPSGKCTSPSHSTPLTAIALQAADHVKLKRDASPSKRYMDILIAGATELQLEQSYINDLKKIVTASPSEVSILLSRQHLIWTSWLFRNNLRGVQSFVSKLLWIFYVPTNGHFFLRKMSDAIHCFILLPGAAIGFGISRWLHFRGQQPYNMFSSVTTNRNNQAIQK